MPQCIQIMWALNVASRNVNIFLSVLYSVLFAAVVLIRDVFIGSFFARMVSSRVQSSADSIRIAVSRIGAIVAMSSAVYSMQKIEVVGPVVICVVLIIGMLLFIRRNTIKNPSIIIF